MEVSKIQSIYNGIIKSNLLEDRQEYEIEDLMDCYQIDNESAKYLFDMINGNSIDINMVSSEELMEAMKESIHQGFDGWEENEIFIIQKYIDDLIIAAIQSR
jgi:hypothetical protein